VAPLDRLTCEEAFRRLDCYVDRELSDAELSQVRDHLDRCARCAAEFTFEQGVIEEVRRKINQVAVPSDLRQRVFERLRDAEAAGDEERA